MVEARGRVGLVVGLGLAVTAIVACGGSETPAPGAGEPGGGEQQPPPPPEMAQDAGPAEPETSIDAGPAAPPDAVADAGVTTDTGAVATVVDAGPAVADDAGAGPTPDERWRAMVRRGRSRFNSVCGTCHPGGNEDIGPRIRGVGFSVSRMRRQIRSGSGRMRPIGPGRVSEADLDNLMAYLSTMGSVRGVQRPQ